MQLIQIGIEATEDCMPRHWHAIGMEFVRWDVVRLGSGCGIGRRTIFDCGELGLICNSLWSGCGFASNVCAGIDPAVPISFFLLLITCF